MPLLVFSDYPKVENVSLDILRDATTLDIYRQHVALGIRAGQSTLFAFEYNGSRRYLMIGVLMASKLQQGKVNKENRLWKHVAPHHTELAILPREMAETFCQHAVENYRAYQYIQDWIGIFSPTDCGRIPVRMHQIELLGDTRSAHDLGVFCNMPSERMCVGCGLKTRARIEDSHPNQRSSLLKLLEAATKLLRFILLLDEQDCEDEEQQELRRVFRQLRKQLDGHFVSMVASLLLAVLTVRTDLCVSGVFGAGKTRAAAALIAGLMIMDPSLNIMVMTKENTAAKAFTDHLLSLGLPETVYCRVGRI